MTSRTDLSAREAAQQLLAKNNIIMTVEKMVNELCRLQPADAHAFMANYLGDLAETPTITKIAAEEVSNSQGMPAVHVSISALVLAKEQVLASEAAPAGAGLVAQLPSEQGAEAGAGAGAWVVQAVGQHQPVELLDAADARCGRRGVLQAVHQAATTLSAAVAGLDPRAQAEVDARLWAADTTDRKATVGGNAILACSLAAARAGAHVAGTSVAKHLGATAASAVPTLAVHLIAIPRAGKLKLRGVYASLAAGAASTARDTVVTLTALFAAVKDVASRKAPLGLPTSPSGALVLSFDKTELLWELLAEATLLAGLEAGQVEFALDCGASGYYDEAKQKYDMLAGQARTRDDLIADYTELCRSRHVRTLIDPLRPEDAAGWAALCQTLSGTARVLVGDSAESRIAACNDPEGARIADGLVLRVAQTGTVTRFLETAAAARAAGLATWLVAADGETGSDILADLAVAGAVSVVVFGAPLRDRAVLFNHAAQLEASLKAL